uniref:Uncharacterized protein n=1 Tax=Romanomermis culicivorax TaxID=13658 RepID=A0A915HMH9_ROMCU
MTSQDCLVYPMGDGWAKNYTIAFRLGNTVLELIKAGEARTTVTARRVAHAPTWGPRRNVVDHVAALTLAGSSALHVFHVASATSS